jgi:predicted phage terminase large subunit-like protein
MAEERKRMAPDEDRGELSGENAAPDYEVGYRRPPLAGRFKPGQTGITTLDTPSAVYLVDVVRERLDYPSLKRRIVEEKWRWKADTVLIEGKGSGISLIQDLKREGVFPIPILPDGDKVVRMSACSAKIEAGAVFLPLKAPWLGAFQVEILAFPHGAHDDQADALSQLLNWVRKKPSYTLDWVG